MKILLAPDSFKGSASAAQLCQWMEDELGRLPGVQIDCLPLADGGEGTVQALCLATGGRMRSVPAQDPLGRTVEAAYCLLGGGGAALEMSAASGLPLVEPALRDPMRTSSYGTGQLLLDAAGLTQTLIIGIGGSATNDGGLGMLSALGARCLDGHGHPVPPGARGLLALEALDLSGLDRRVLSAELTVACDVDSPLCGPQGATAVFGPQKGLRPGQLATVDRAMARYGALLARETGVDTLCMPGAGAAGGMGGALMACLGARLTPGFPLISQLTGLERRLQDCDLLITGEGRLNRQSLLGKAPVEAARLAARCGVRTAAIVGSAEGTAEEYGLDLILTLMRPGMEVEYAMAHVEELVRQAARSLLLETSC